jgi:hypothetical protein
MHLARVKKVEDPMDWYKITLQDAYDQVNNYEENIIIDHIYNFLGSRILIETKIWKFIAQGIEQFVLGISMDRYNFPSPKQLICSFK